MQEILKEIFEGGYTPTTCCRPMTAEEREVWDNAQKVLGGEMIDKMEYAQSRSLTETQYDYFREGFRLGALLMLELR